MSSTHPHPSSVITGPDLTDLCIASHIIRRADRNDHARELF